MKIEINYNGKSYDDIKDAVEQAVIDGATESIKKSISTFKEEIEKNNGTVKIEVSGTVEADDLKVIVTLDDMPDDLIDKIENSL